MNRRLTPLAGLLWSLAALGAGLLAHPAGAQPDAAAPTPAVRTLADELAQLVDDAGRLVDPAQPAAATAVRAVSDKAARLVRSEPGLAGRLAASRLHLRALSALVGDALRREASAEASLWLARLRAAAHQARTLGGPEARAMGEYWLTLAELVDARRNHADLADQQAAAIDALDRYLAGTLVTQPEPAPPGDGPDAVPWSRPAAALLIRLLDQAGLSGEMCGQLAQLPLDAGGEPAADAALAEARAVCDRLGQTVELAVPLPGGGAWRVADQRGRVVVLHFFHDDAPRLIELFEALRTLRARHAEEALAVVSLSVGPTRIAGSELGWPLIELSPGAAGSPAEALGVMSLPRVYILDAEGRLAASGQTAAALGSVAALTADADAGRGTAVGSGGR